MRSQYYEKYIQSPEWDEKKAERLLIDGGKCVMCGRPASKCRNGLQVHHVTYRNLGHEDALTELCTLCGSCHRKIHNYLSRRQE